MSIINRLKKILNNDRTAGGESKKQAHTHPDSDNKDSLMLLNTPYRPAIQSISRDGIQTYWKKPEDAGGYEIYRSYDPSQIGELVKVIDDKLLGVWMDKTFDPSYRRIYYRVRSFRKEEDGSVLYSDFSDQFSAAYRDQVELERDITYIHSGSSRLLRAFYGWGEVNDAVWKSTDESIASIDENGLITGNKKGECKVICTSLELGIETSSTVIVDRSAPEPLSPVESRYAYNSETRIWEKISKTENDDAVIMMAGDMMCGKGQIEQQYSQEEGWNFNDSFEYVREVTRHSDFTIGNLETLLDPAWPYMTDEWFINNISNCNAPPRYLDAIKYGGFDGVILANNHSCDGGVPAIKATLEQVDLYKLVRTGAFKDSSEPRFTIVDINGIRVGYLAYMSPATGYNGKDRRWSREEKSVILNNYTQKKAVRDIADCRKAGAEYIIVYMHWGQKNYREPTEIQVSEAQGIADAGADFIVGSNPHVLERYDELISADGRCVPCYYSIGNFQARMNQVEGNRDSVIVRIRLKRNKEGGVILAENNYIPFYTYNKYEKSYLPPISVSYRYANGIKRKGRKEKCERIQASIGSKVAIYKGDD